MRVVRGGSETLFVSMPPEWSDFDVSGLGGRSGLWEQAQSGSRAARLEVASARLPGGTLLQVGKSTENREELLARFRTIVTLVSVAIVLIGLAGGILVTRRTLEPIHRLIAAVSAITRTGSTDTRVPVGTDRDAIDELSALVQPDARSNQHAHRGHGERARQRRARSPHADDAAARRGRTGARQRSGGGNLQAQREALSTCLEESERILAMLDTLMDISEAETGTMRLALAPVDLDALVREVVSVYEDVAEDKQIDLRTALDEGLSVTGDRDRLRQVLANLVDNAIKYTPSGGRVTVSAAADGDSIRIEVADTGIGIAAHDLPRIWERLYRGDHSRAERGLGLGLSLVRAIVRAHGGTVDVQTELGRGSTFTIRLPKVHPPRTVRSY